MLVLEGVIKSFSDYFRPALDINNLTVERGEFCVVVGSNGSGKSTLLKIISGEYGASSGTITLLGKDVTKLDMQKRSKFIGQVTQDINKGTIPEMTLLENIVLSQLRGKFAGLGFYRSYARAEEILQRSQWNYDGSLNSYLENASGGQRQTIATLMAIGSNPELLLLDEHTSALDPVSQKSLMRLTAEAVQRADMTTIMITHKLDDALHYGSRILMMHEGKIVSDLKRNSRMTVQDLLELFHAYQNQEMVQHV